MDSISRTQIEYIRCDFNTITYEERHVSLENQVVSRKDICRYLGSMLCRDIDKGISQWMRWRQTFDVLYDNRIPQKFYRMTIRSATLFGAEC